MASESDGRDPADEYEVEDPAIWATPEEIPRTARLDVTISVRFSPEEIAQIRATAKAVGLKPTTFIRRAALTQTHEPLDLAILQAKVTAALAELQTLADVVARAEGGRLPTPRQEAPEPVTRESAEG